MSACNVLKGDSDAFHTLSVKFNHCILSGNDEHHSIVAHQVNSEWELVRLVEQWFRCGPSEVTSDPSKHQRRILRHIRVPEIVRDDEENDPPEGIRQDILTYVHEQVYWIPLVF